MLNQHKTIKDNIEKYNRLTPLVDYLLRFIGNKKSIKIADIGSGPFNTIGHFVDIKPDIEVSVYSSDKQDFTKFYKKHNVTPLYKIDYEDMEKLTYPDESFDIVHCANALDHTLNAERAVKEMIRVCKVGGWVYIECSLYQLDTGFKHYWNATEEGAFENKEEWFSLKDHGFNVRLVDNGGEKRYNKIIATLNKQPIGGANT